MARDKRKYAGQSWGRSISDDGTICDTLKKRMRKARQARLGAMAPPKKPAHAAVRSAVPELVQALNMAYRMLGITR